MSTRSGTRVQGKTSSIGLGILPVLGLLLIGVGALIALLLRADLLLPAEWVSAEEYEALEAYDMDQCQELKFCAPKEWSWEVKFPDKLIMRCKLPSGEWATVGLAGTQMYHGIDFNWDIPPAGPNRLGGLGAKGYWNCYTLNSQRGRDHQKRFNMFLRDYYGWFQ